VERKHRHVVVLGLTLLSQANLPLTYWDHGFLTVVRLINRLPTASLNFSFPYTTLFHKNSEYTSLKVFGSARFPLLRPYNSHKFDFRSHECIFLGYSTTHKGYKCLPPTGRIFASKDVMFNEFRFPYESLFSAQNSALSDPIQDVPISTLPIGTQNQIPLPVTSNSISQPTNTNPTHSPPPIITHPTSLNPKTPTAQHLPPIIPPQTCLMTLFLALQYNPLLLIPFPLNQPTPILCKQEPNLALYFLD
jgi:histone deacetylase 1/2